MSGRKSAVLFVAAMGLFTVGILYVGVLVEEARIEAQEACESATWKRVRELWPDARDFKVLGDPPAERGLRNGEGTWRWQADVRFTRGPDDNEVTQRASAVCWMRRDGAKALVIP